MTEKKTRRALRMNNLRSDGRPNTEPIVLVVRDPSTNEPMVDEKTGAPEVTITLQPMSDDERKQIVADRTTPQRDPNGGRGLYELTDHVEVTNDVLRKAVTSWDGIIGADDRPLVCNQQTVVLIDSSLKAQITRKLFGAEAVEVAAESFR